MSISKEQRSWATRELGLEAGYRYFKSVLKTEHLHYGLFEPDIPVDILSLKAAQDRYLERLAESIPAGTRSILDVGCGSGKTAEVLIGKGYGVDCVSPGQFLTGVAAERLGDRSKIYRGKFEDVAIDRRYDLVLFSESFSYIPVEAALAKSIAVLNPGGHLLICDFFHREDKGPCPIGGGHDYAAWCAAYSRAPLDLVSERDITTETAPVHDVAQSFVSDVGRPMWHSAKRAAEVRWPRASRIAFWLLRSKIDKLERRRLSPDRTGATFRNFKIYKRYLFQLRTEGAHA